MAARFADGGQGANDASPRPVVLARGGHRTCKVVEGEDADRTAFGIDDGQPPDAPRQDRSISSEGAADPAYPEYPAAISPGGATAVTSTAVTRAPNQPANSTARRMACSAHCE
jgi:hypothetical protein